MFILLIFSLFVIFSKNAKLHKIIGFENIILHYNIFFILKQSVKRLLIESYVEFYEQCEETAVGRHIGLGGHAFVEVRAPRGKNAYTAMNVVVDFGGVGDVAEMAGRAQIGVEFFGAASEIKVYARDEELTGGVVAKIVLHLAEEKVARVVDLRGFGRSFGTHEISVIDNAVRSHVIETHEGLIEACILEGIPFDMASEHAIAHGVVEGEAPANGIAGERTDRVAGLDNEIIVFLLDERYRVGRGQDGVVGGVANGEDVRIVLVQAILGAEEIERLCRAGEVAGIAVARGVLE